jgi:hypothetical protein
MKERVHLLILFKIESITGENMKKEKYIAVIRHGSWCVSRQHK